MARVRVSLFVTGSDAPFVHAKALRALPVPDTAPGASVPPPADNSDASELVANDILAGSDRMRTGR